LTFIKYGVIQLLAYALDMGTFLLLISLFYDEAILANIAGKGIAGLFAFFLHRHFTFKSNSGSGKFQALSYFLLLAINIPIASALFGAGLYFVDSPAGVKFASDVVCVVVTYWISKLFVFRSAAQTSVRIKGI
jgi:putative flippase GtrA